MSRVFVNHLIDLVHQEKKASLLSERKLLLGDPRDLERKGIAILNLSGLENERVVKSKKWRIVLECLNMPNHKIVVGDMVQIRRYGSRFDPSDETTTGIVSSINDTEVNIVSINEIPTRGSLNIVKFPSQETFRRMLEALKKLNSKLVLSTEYNDFFRPSCSPRHIDLKEVDFIGQDLGISQMEAVKFCVGPDKISLIHGPPGTGKTHTLIEIIRQLAEKQKLRLLVCAPSNTAVDNILRRIMKYEHINTLRVGNIARVAPDLHSRTTEELEYDLYEYSKEYLPAGSELDDLTDILDRLSLDQLKERSIEKTLVRRGKKPELLLMEADVVFCTLNGSGNALMEDKTFDVVIIDEAGQATEPDCWIALLKSKKIILCGDHLQLPPTILSKVKNVQDPRAKGLSILNNLSYTLFDRLMYMHGEKIKRTLTMQYRMHEEIMKFSSQELYENKLVAHESVAGHLLMDLPNVNSCESTNSPLMLIDTGDASVFHETKKSRKGVERSSANDMEVVLVEKHIEILMQKGGLEQVHIGVITPYAAQVFSMRNVINKRWKHIEVNSIDGYQGREKECIIISMVRSNREGNVGFLSDKRRLNVAMTRARRQLVVIGDTRTLLSSGPSVTISSARKREFLTKWIGWIEDKANKKLSKRYLSFRQDNEPLR